MVDGIDSEDSLLAGMPAVYLDTCFRCEGDWGDVPDRFALITGYATTGETWTDAENTSADLALEREVRRLAGWVRRITGYSPNTGFTEPGWAVSLNFETACDLGIRFRQNAIYYVIGDALFVSYCDARRGLVEMGGFSERLTKVG